MALLTPTLLANLGIELSEQDYQSLEQHIETTLNERVINEIVLELTPAQAQELANLNNASDDEIQVWLQANVQNLNEIVSDEIDILLGELAENSEALAGS